MRTVIVAYAFNLGDTLLMCMNTKIIRVLMLGKTKLHVIEVGSI